MIVVVVVVMEEEHTTIITIMKVLINILLVTTTIRITILVEAIKILDLRRRMVVAKVEEKEEDLV